MEAPLCRESGRDRADGSDQGWSGDGAGCYARGIQGNGARDRSSGLCSALGLGDVECRRVEPSAHFPSIRSLCAAAAGRDHGAGKGAVAGFERGPLGEVSAGEQWTRLYCRLAGEIRGRNNEIAQHSVTCHCRGRSADCLHQHRQSAAGAERLAPSRDCHACGARRYTRPVAGAAGDRIRRARSRRSCWGIGVWRNA